MKNDYITLKDLEQWVDNDEALYRAWKNSRLNKRTFVSINAEDLRAYVSAIINRKPRD